MNQSISTVEAYPLHWPAGWPRTADDDRGRGKFSRGERVYSQQPGGSSYVSRRSMTVFEGINRVVAELRKFGVSREQIVISSNLRSRNDGLPRSDAAEPDDPGIAVYWTMDGERQCMAIDSYTRTADNLAAIAATIDAMRAIERHGGAQILRRAFQGFRQLASGAGGAPEEMVLSLTDAARIISDVGRAAYTPDEIKTDADDAKAAIRIALKHGHPDHAHGSAATFSRVTAARAVIAQHHGASL